MDDIRNLGNVGAPVTQGETVNHVELVDKDRVLVRYAVLIGVLEEHACVNAPSKRVTRKTTIRAADREAGVVVNLGRKFILGKALHGFSTDPATNSPGISSRVLSPRPRGTRSKVRCVSKFSLQISQQIHHLVHLASIGSVLGEVIHLLRVIS